MIKKEITLVVQQDYWDNGLGWFEPERVMASDIKIASNKNHAKELIEYNIQLLKDMGAHTTNLTWLPDGADFTFYTRVEEKSIRRGRRYTIVSKTYYED